MSAIITRLQNQIAQHERNHEMLLQALGGSHGQIEDEGWTYRMYKSHAPPYEPIVVATRRPKFGRKVVVTRLSQCGDKQARTHLRKVADELGLP